MSAVISGTLKAILPLVLGVLLGIVTGVGTAVLVAWKVGRNDGVIDPSEGLQIGWAWWKPTGSALGKLPGLSVITSDLETAVALYQADNAPGE